ncbi:hypothetical protein A5906_06690 [Bradyrhizobium sacchari]|uniref:DUF1134 domain-containing protein n=1 Tax=Bradyrhizobium sacchari TaxID=1399419 RepID=A0A560KKE6_9BRAD|nr:hypothetical protein [Bradyrhizobium sacchari]OPY95665.1 hypothetical protein A5906_06690 [Bradyrhizobium sacchari]TWB66504.1 hypothetical protein FBZ94_101177 [Bradyrhizobium sacchari]TWB83741.1 hypothetical protein FBZ95_101177 [Bradyrhizobium sacchari]
MPRSLRPDRVLRAIAAGLAALTLVLLAMPATPSFAQASGQVRVKFVKAGLLVGGGAGSGVLTYRGRNYPFSIAGLSLGITAGASVGRFEGRASGIREVADFSGTYSSVGGGFALVGGINGIQLRNEKGVTLVLQGPKAGLELAANISQITISLK